jgi:hypothetical protein
MTAPDRIWPTSSTARRTSACSPANATAASAAVSDMTASLPPPTDSAKRVEFFPGS